MRKIRIVAALMGFAAVASFTIAPAEAKRRPDPVKRAISRVFLAGQIQAADRDSYLDTYRAAIRLRPKLGFTRARELGYVIDTLRTIAMRLLGAKKPLSVKR